MSKTRGESEDPPPISIIRLLGVSWPCYNCGMSTVPYLDRFLDPFTKCFTTDAAKRVSEWRADPKTQARIDLLADKNTDGELTAAERDEYETYVRAGTFISILQSKARALLTEKSAS